jgi:hypothetical protein
MNDELEKIIMISIDMNNKGQKKLYFEKETSENMV